MIILLNEFECGFSMGDDRYCVKRIGEPQICRDNIYAGCVMKYDKKKNSVKPCRKIVFIKNSDETTRELLYNNIPNYPIGQKDNQKYYVAHTIKLESVLKFFWYDEYLNNKNIENILDYVLSEHGYAEIAKSKNVDLTISEYEILKALSQLRKKPTRQEKKLAKTLNQK